MDFVRTIKQKTARGLPRQSFGEECFGEADPFLRRNLFAKQQQAKRFEESFSERNWFSLKSISLDFSLHQLARLDSEREEGRILRTSSSWLMIEHTSSYIERQATTEMIATMESSKRPPENWTFAQCASTTCAGECNTMKRSKFSDLFIVSPFPLPFCSVRYVYSNSLWYLVHPLNVSP